MYDITVFDLIRCYVSFYYIFHKFIRLRSYNQRPNFDELRMIYFHKDAIKEKNLFSNITSTWTINTEIKLFLIYSNLMLNNGPAKYDFNYHLTRMV